MLFIYLILLFTCSLFTTIPLITCTFIFTYCLTLISNIIILFHCLSPFLFIYHFILFCLTLLIPVISIGIALFTYSCHYWAVWLHQEPFKDIISKSITPIDNKIIKTILLARKSLLFNKNEIWVKKNNLDFDVTMSTFDGAEVCELVGFISFIFSERCLMIGLYRDDGLSCFQNLLVLNLKR